MKKSQFVIDEKIAASLMGYYLAMAKLVMGYRQELVRSSAHRRERRGINFSVFGKALTPEDMLDVQNTFLDKMPADCQAELMFLLHERESNGGIKFVMCGLEDFLKKLPGAKLPEPRPAAMDDLMRIA